MNERLASAWRSFLVDREFTNKKQTHRPDFTLRETCVLSKLLVILILRIMEILVITRNDRGGRQDSMADLPLGQIVSLPPVLSAGGRQMPLAFGI